MIRVKKNPHSFFNFLEWVLYRGRFSALMQGADAADLSHTNNVFSTKTPTNYYRRNLKYNFFLSSFMQAHRLTFSPKVNAEIHTVIQYSETRVDVNRRPSNVQSARNFHEYNLLAIEIYFSSPRDCKSEQSKLVYSEPWIIFRLNLLKLIISL